MNTQGHCIFGSFPPQIEGVRRPACVGRDIAFRRGKSPTQWGIPLEFDAVRWSCGHASIAANGADVGRGKHNRDRGVPWHTRCTTPCSAREFIRRACGLRIMLREGVR